MITEIRPVDLLQDVARKWLSEHQPNMHLIKAICHLDGTIVCAVLTNFDGKRGKRHPAITIPNIRWAM